MKTLRHLFRTPPGRTAFYSMMLPLLFGAFLFNVNSLKHATKSAINPVDETATAMEEDFTDFTFTGAAGIFWTDEGSWTPSYPGTEVLAGNTVSINAAMLVNVNVNLFADVNVNAGSGVLNNGSMFTQKAGTLSLNSGLWTGDIFSDAGSTVHVLEGAQWRIGADHALGGDLRVDGLVIAFNNNTDLTVNGNVSGTGSLLGPTPTAQIILNGEINPGDVGETGCLNLSVVANNNSTATNIEVNGTTPCTEHDQIRTNNAGDYYATGTLNVIVDYTPADGDQIVLVQTTNTSIIGTYETVNLPDNWEIAYNSPNEGQITITYSEETPPVTNEGTLVWQMHNGQGLGKFIPGVGEPTVREILTQLYGPSSPQHGDPGGYAYANIPPADDADWMPAPVDPEDGQLCFRLDRSTIEGNMTELDFTYFQTSITVSDTTLPFIVEYLQVDDGVRAYVFNDRYLSGTFLPDGPDDDEVPDGDARLYQTPASADLTSLLVPGENRIVLVQFDNASTQNFLKVVANYDSGDPCANDTEAPIMDLSAIVLDTLECISPEDAPAPILVTAVDNCDSIPVVETAVLITAVNDTMVVPFDDVDFRTIITELGTQVDWVYTATDASGNTTVDTVAAYFLNKDKEFPEVTNCPTDTVSIEVDSAGQVITDLNSFGIVATDNCTPTESLVLSSEFLDFGPDGQALRVIFTDESGNSSQCAFTVTTESPDPCDNDVTAPQFFLVDLDTNDTIPVMDGDTLSFCEIRNFFLSAFAVDNCDPNPTFTVEGGAFENLPDGRQLAVVTLEASDDSGNVSSGSITVLQGDATPPVIEGCPTDVVDIQLDANGEYIPNVDSLGITVSDNCGVESVTFSPEIITEATQVVTLEVTDASGNTNVCEFSVNPIPVDPCFEDMTPPYVEITWQIVTPSRDTVLEEYVFTVTQDGDNIFEVPCSADQYPQNIANQFSMFDECEGRIFGLDVTFDPSVTLPDGSISITYTLIGQDGSGNVLNTTATVISKSDDGTCEPAIVENTVAPGEVMNLYPNPASGILTIDLADDNQLKWVEVRDRLGRLMWTQTLQDGQTQVQVNLSDGTFSRGLYTVSVYSETGIILTKQLSVIE